MCEIRIDETEVTCLVGTKVSHFSCGDASFFFLPWMLHEMLLLSLSLLQNSFNQVYLSRFYCIAKLLNLRPTYFFFWWGLSSFKDFFLTDVSLVVDADGLPSCVQHLNFPEGGGGWVVGEQIHVSSTRRNLGFPTSVGVTGGTPSATTL